MAKLCRVIKNETRLVVIDKDLSRRLQGYERVSRTELVQRSVQMYPSKVDMLGISSISTLFEGSEELYSLPESWEYDPDCYGYMAEVLKMQAAAIPNGYFI